jgi:hypothetical protein
MLATAVMKKIYKITESLNGRKFAQSGHPACAKVSRKNGSRHFLKIKSNFYRVLDFKVEGRDAYSELFTF